MKTLFYALLLSPFLLTAQNYAKNYEAVNNFYTKINIDNVDLDSKTIDYNYSKDTLSINSIIKYSFCLVCSDDGKVVSRAYLKENRILIKLREKRTYYLRLDNRFSTKTYKIKF